MNGDIGYQEIQDYIDQDHSLIDRYEQVPDKDLAYQFVIFSSNLTINIVKAEKKSPIVIGTQIGLPDDALEIIHDSRQLQFVGEMAAVLANAPGLYSYVDTRGNPAPVDQFTHVDIRSWVYPDGANQHTIMNTIIDLLSALTYIQDTTNRITNEAKAGQ